MAAACGRRASTDWRRDQDTEMPTFEFDVKGEGYWDFRLYPKSPSLRVEGVCMAQGIISDALFDRIVEFLPDRHDQLVAIRNTAKAARQMAAREEVYCRACSLVRSALEGACAKLPVGSGVPDLVSLMRDCAQMAEEGAAARQLTEAAPLQAVEASGSYTEQALRLQGVCEEAAVAVANKSTETSATSPSLASLRPPPASAPGDLIGARIEVTEGTQVEVTEVEATVEEKEEEEMAVAQGAEAQQRVFGEGRGAGGLGRRLSGGRRRHVLRKPNLEKLSDETSGELRLPRSRRAGEQRLQRLRRYGHLARRPLHKIILIRAFSRPLNVFTPRGRAPACRRGSRALSCVGVEI